MTAAPFASLAALLMAAGAAVADEGLVISPLPVETLQPLRIEGQVIGATPEAPETPAPDRIAAAGPARRADLPEPSIILGDMAVLMTTVERGPLGIPRPAREAIRQRDEAMFQRLLTQGAFDPDQAQVPAALQAELGQMGCYDGAIDGDWGAGSASGLARYFQTLGAAEAATVPDIALFRTIAGHEAVVCPEIRVSAPAATRNPPAAANRNPAATNRSRAAASRNPSRSGGAGDAGAAAPSAGTERRINPGLLGSGVFR